LFGLSSDRRIVILNESEVDVLSRASEQAAEIPSEAEEAWTCFPSVIATLQFLVNG
jgi:hypothetical protein